MRAARMILVVAISTFACAAWGQSMSQSGGDAALAQKLATESYAMSAKYVGPGSCAASSCHGGIQARNTTKVLQNEYSTWIVQDRHSRAYAALLEPRSARMAKILKIGPPQKAQECLVCHALDVPKGQMARPIDLSDGVSCESCHGPASEWLGPHVQMDASYSDMVKLGLIDNRNLVVRAKNCLTCHLGSPTQEVTHEMLAAGHPDLTFELDSFQSIEPPHWVEWAQGKNKPGVDSLYGVRIWSVGQIVQLRESLLKLTRDVNSNHWPEYTDMNCFSCHHSLTSSKNSWRQAVGYSGRRPGNPSYNMSRYIVFEHFLDEIDPSGAAKLKQDMATVYTQASELNPDRATLVQNANIAAADAKSLESEVNDAVYTHQRTMDLLESISGDGQAISLQGERSAEQAAMALDSLYIADTKNGHPNPAVRSSIDAMYKMLSNPSAYNAPMFAAQMARVHAALE
ncbi:MAG: multiheme c-type cytochrome [Acidobacteriaceae bacterium]